MSDSCAKAPKIISAEEAQARDWDDDFTEIYNDYQLYCLSNGDQGAPITNAKNINFPYNLTSTYFKGADLTGADLARVNLVGANLTAVNLTDAVLWGADLTGADLTDAVLDYDSLSQIKNGKKADFTNTLIIHNRKLLGPEVSRQIIRARTEYVAIEEKQALENEKFVYDLKVALIGPALAITVFSGALTVAFMIRADSDPLKEISPVSEPQQLSLSDKFEVMSPSDQKDVCASTEAQKFPVIVNACAEANWAMPAPVVVL